MKHITVFPLTIVLIFLFLFSFSAIACNGEIIPDGLPMATQQGFVMANFIAMGMPCGTCTGYIPGNRLCDEMTAQHGVALNMISSHDRCINDRKAGNNLMIVAGETATTERIVPEEHFAGRKIEINENRSVRNVLCYAKAQNVPNGTKLNIYHSATTNKTFLWNDSYCTYDFSQQYIYPE